MIQKQTRTASRLSDPSTAFEDLRREISLQRSAIEGLTAAKDKLPDYAPTLREMSQRLAGIEDQISSIREKPALLTTPLTLAAELFEASKIYRAEDRAAIAEGREALARSLGRVEGMMSKVRSTERQDWWVTWAGTGGVLCGALFSLVGVAIWL